ncbi:hypothetical protein BU23DRAFT_572073 [Bimuria novae-zelandiae CBS 107.79]|uniref:Uncharacterized protein n=1 Tax=Bimuria novae-zelandiae CBS 107.79 TaxID=1447943 RepID=A0A6A5UY35_9PLEO|nr:hypothetical protein BU23DRAFT_572073 [Bimuria novae-zelandiae CBS 107.79]
MARHNAASPKTTQVNRRKPRKYKVTKLRVNKTARRELTAVEQAFVVGAVVLGNATFNEVAASFEPQFSKAGISRLVKRIKGRAEELKVLISDPVLYKGGSGHGRPTLLTDTQKKRIIEIVTQDRAHHEKEAL